MLDSHWINYLLRYLNYETNHRQIESLYRHVVRNFPKQDPFTTFFTAITIFTIAIDDELANFYKLIKLQIVPFVDFSQILTNILTLTDTFSSQTINSKLHNFMSPTNDQSNFLDGYWSKLCLDCLKFQFYLKKDVKKYNLTKSLIYYQKILIQSLNKNQNKFNSLEGIESLVEQIFENELKQPNR